MLTSLHLHKKSSEVSFKTRSTPASFSIQGQDTKQTTVKWPIFQYFPRKTSLENMSSRYSYFFAIIPIRPICTMWPNYPVTEQVGMAFKFKQRMKNLPWCAHVLHKTLNLVISRCRLAECGEEMYKNLKRTCMAFVFSLNPIVL